jgi:hypothetical protein
LRKDNAGTRPHIDFLTDENAEALARFHFSTHENGENQVFLDYLTSENIQTRAPKPRFCSSAAAKRRAPKAIFLPVGNFLRKSSLFFLPVGNRLRIHLTIAYRLLYDVIVMSDVFTNRSWQSRGNGLGEASTPQKPPRIRLDVPMGTSYCEIQEIIFRQAWQLAGTQLRAAIALGLTPETISRFLRRCDRMRIGFAQIPEAWPVVAPPKPVDRVKDQEDEAFLALTSSENAQEEISPSSSLDDDPERNEW